MSIARKPANGRASDLALTSGFLVDLAHRATSHRLHRPYGLTAGKDRQKLGSLFINSPDILLIHDLRNIFQAFEHLNRGRNIFFPPRFNAVGARKAILFFLVFSVFFFLVL